MEQTSKMFLFLAEILNLEIVDSEGKLIGKVADLKATLGELFPKIAAICVRGKRDKKLFSLDWEAVDTIGENVIRLKKEKAANLLPLEMKEKEILLKEEILDKQVMDTMGAKVERVNDVHLLLSEGELRVVHVDYGVRGIFRRLGWIRWVDLLTNWLFAYEIPDKLISWKYIQPLASDPTQKALKLNVTVKKMHEIHPSDLADILEELGKQQRTAVFKSLDVETAADALEEVDPKFQVSLIESAAEPRASDILEEMAPDEAVDLLLSLPEEKKEKLVLGMEKEKREKLRELLKFREGTAGSIMTTEFISLMEDKTVEEAIEKFKESSLPLETISYIYATNNLDQLVGVLTLRNLILSHPETPLTELMNKDVIIVKIEDDVDKVAEIFKKYKFMALPVVDEKEHLKGIITLRDAVDATFPEFQE
jgi:magnesium transporter